MIDDSAAVWLYGSAARGDADSESDVDVLVIADRPISRSEALSISNADPSKLALTQYAWDEIEKIAAYGSLFLVHLKKEGKVLREGAAVRGRFRRILDSVEPYQRAALDVKAFENSLADARESLNQRGSVPFELSLLGIVFRHASILGCYVSGYPCFGRSEPIRKLVDLWGLDPSASQLFDQLYQYRLSAVRRHRDLPILSVDQALAWCERIDKILETLKEKVDAYERDLPLSNRES